MTYNIQDIINHLEAARLKSPDLAGVIDLHCALLQTQMQAAPPAMTALPTANQIEQALHEGTPLLRLTEFSLDPRETTHLAVEVCRIIATHRPDLAESLEPISRHLSQNGQIKQVISQYLNGENPNITRDEDHSVDPNLLTFILIQTLRPFLQAAIRSFQPETTNLKSTFGQNPQPTCPMCGGSPDFAALVSPKSEGDFGRRLLCARCDTEWSYQRSGCPFCEQVEQWAYFPDENEVFRLYVCDVCHHYLKTVDWRQTFAHRLLPVERMLTVGMDIAAAQAGYIGYLS